MNLSLIFLAVAAMSEGVFNNILSSVSDNLPQERHNGAHKKVAID